MPLKTWVTQKLHRGDLHALAAAAGHGGDLPNLDQLKRLSMRGLVTQNAGKISVTMKGRLALVVRRFIFG